MGGKNANRVKATEADKLGKGAGEEKHKLTVDEMPSHSHSLGYTYPFAGSANSLATGSNIGGSRRTNSTGGNGPHNNMPPYLTLNYIIKI